METLSSNTGDETNCLGRIDEEWEEDSEEEEEMEENKQEKDIKERKGETTHRFQSQTLQTRWELHMEIKASDWL